MLTDTAIKNLKPGTTPIKKSDGGGLFLQVNPNGSRLWRLGYRFGGKQKLLSMGIYPDVSLKQARERRDEARRLLAEGIDPSVHRQTVKAMDASRTANSFEAVVREWFAKFSTAWNAQHQFDVMSRFEHDIFPWLGAKPVDEVSAADLLACLRRIEERGSTYTAHLTRRDCARAFKYAQATGRATRDPTIDLVGALAPRQIKHHAAITDPAELGALLRSIDSYQGTFIVRCALKLLPLVFLRGGELRKMEWKEIDLEAGEARIPAGRMKMKLALFVPLSTQAVTILRELHPVTGGGRFVFPSVGTVAAPMSENTILSALRRMGYTGDEMTPHGFRSTASTLLNELGWHRDAIERQLAHAEQDAIRGAYNRAEHLPERRRMMQAWADYLDQLAGENVLPLRIAAAS